MNKIIAIAFCTLMVGACTHKPAATDTSAKEATPSCCEKKEMDCCKDAKKKGKDCTKC